MTNITEQEAVNRTQQVMELLYEWGVSSEQIIDLLALENHVKPRQLSRFRRGTYSFPATGLVQQRIEHLLGIADALRTMYPHNSQIGAVWINQTHRRFAERTPLQTMIEDGLNGILYVRCHVDCAFDWAQDAGRNAE